MRDNHAYPRLLFTAAGVLACLVRVQAQSGRDDLPTADSRHNVSAEVVTSQGEGSLPSERQEVTAEELRSLRPATLLNEQPDEGGEPLSAANSPRSTAYPNEAGVPIARPSGQDSAGPADADQGKVVAKDRERSAGGWFALKDFLPLTVVLALILALAWIIKRYRPTQAMLGGGGVLEVVARLPVSSKQTLLLVRMGRQVVLLGQSQDTLSMLAEVNDPEEVSTLIGEVVSRTNRSLSHEFAEAFESESTLYEDDLDPAEEARGHVRSLLNRVRRLSRSREVA